MADPSQQKLQVFLCHAKEDKHVVRDLWGKLTKEPWGNAWLDEEDLLPGDDWRLVIQDAVRSADIVIVFLSKRSTTKDGFVHREVKYALEVADEKPRGSIFIIPMRLDENCNVPYDVRQWQVLDYFSHDDKPVAYDKLIKSFKKKIRQLRETQDILTSDVAVSLPKKEYVEHRDGVIPVVSQEIESINNEQKPKSYGWATCKNPGLLIYIIDVSESMNELLNGERKIGLVNSLLKLTFQNLISRSHDGNKIFPTYKIGVFAYAENIIPIYDGLKTLDQIAAIGAPEISDVMKESTDTAKAFAHVLKLLKSELAEMQDSPAPLICHITDGNFTGVDPKLFVDELSKVGTNHGNTMIQNIFFTENMLVEPIGDLSKWGGVKGKNVLKHKYAKKLFDMSSTILDNYRGRLNDFSTGQIFSLLVQCPFFITKATKYHEGSEFKVSFVYLCALRGEDF